MTPVYLLGQKGMAEKSEDKSINWRKKYLDALDQQEQQEKASAAQQELLRRALVRVSVSADGQDDALDTILGQLRESLRGSITKDMHGVLVRLDEVVLKFEQHRDSNVQAVRQSLMDTIKPLQQLELSRVVKKEISQYLAQLPQHCKKPHLYPTLLKQLATIQQQALKQLERPKTGLWQKLLGSKSEEKIIPSDAIKNSDQHKNNVQVSLEDKPVQDASLEVEKSTDRNLLNTVKNTATTTKLNLAIDDELLEAAHCEKTMQAPRGSCTTALPPDFFDEVTLILHQLLTGLESEPSIAKKSHGIRATISNNKNADDFLRTLEKVRDLVMQSYLSSNQAFAAYLNNVNQELAEIYSLVGGAAESETRRKGDSHKLQHTMLQGINDLETKASSATDLAQLKSQVKSQIGHIRQAFDQYQQTEQQQLNLTLQLETLCSKIKNMEAEAEKNRSILEKNRHTALHDPLTELPNREYYNERSAYEFQRWQRYDRPLTIAVFDIDHFKKVNDNYGHQAGDKVLKVIGSSIAKRLREVDFFCRFGGEEFVALMPETHLQEAIQVLDTIRAAIANASFNYKDQPLSITISIGVTEFKQSDDVETAFARADKALYAAKANGRNCTQCEE